MRVKATIRQQNLSQQPCSSGIVNRARREGSTMTVESTIRFGLPVPLREKMMSTMSTKSSSYALSLIHI